MTNQLAQSARLDRLFHALSDPTRRAVLQRLVKGEAPVKELARPFPMALPSFLQHLRVLEESGLVHSRKDGRVRTYRVEPKQIAAAEGWLSEQRTRWEERLDRFDDYVTSLKKENDR